MTVKATLLKSTITAIPNRAHGGEDGKDGAIVQNNVEVVSEPDHVTVFITIMKYGHQVNVLVLSFMKNNVIKSHVNGK